MSHIVSQGDHYDQIFEKLNHVGETFNHQEFESCVFKQCDFSQGKFEQCRFIDCQFIQCNFSSASLPYCSLEQVEFKECKMSGIDWTRLEWSALFSDSPVNFIECLVDDCSFFGLKLPKLSLKNCRSHHVDFREGDFSGANFQSTDFSQSLFGQTILNECDFSEAINYQIDLRINQINNATFSSVQALSLLSSIGVNIVD